jgi:hypothetical protein
MERSGADLIPLDRFASLPPLEQRRLAQVLSEAIVRTPPDHESYELSLTLLDQLIKSHRACPGH